MTLFSSQFDRVRAESRAYTGEASETRFWVPAVVALGAAAALAATSEGVEVGAEDAAAGWGEGWDQGWDAGAVPDSEPVADDGGAWSHSGDYTDASVGGDGDFFYFIDGDSSLTIG
ncbi:hypothetical protein AB0I81_39185 [Nonomuraea sp. NPDC050404]|uniref:hypothetical protein n=1 Tax=Nonomuraea sp. NPDC050404 TaxID=3155783 RepID=UPI0033DE5028